MAEDYRRASYESWQRMADGWDRKRRWVADLSREVNDWMVKALAPQPGQTILELAAGAGDTGFAAAAALGLDGKLISTDFAPNMVEAARAEAKRLGLQNVEHRRLDAEHMELPDHSVDGVLCRWGYMLTADPQAALAETRRVLRDGGRLVFSVWGDPRGNPWASVPASLLNQYAGIAPPVPNEPSIFAIADPERTRSLLAGAGFKPRRMENIEVVWTFEDFDDYWAYLMELAGRIAMTIETLSEEDHRSFRARLAESLEPYRANGGYALPGVTQNTVAV